MEVNFRLIGTHIKECRINSRLTQALLAERTGLSVPYISQVETAYKHISLNALIKIAGALDVTVDRLLLGNQSADAASYLHGMEQLFADCSDYERSVILDSSTALKRSLRRHRGAPEAHGSPAAVQGWLRFE